MSEVRPRRDALQLFSLAQGAVHDPNLRAQGFGAVVRDFHARVLRGYVEGQLVDRVTLQEANALIRLASEQFRAQAELGRAVESFQRTGQDVALTGAMRARDIDTAPGSGFAYPATDRIRFQIHTEINGERLNRWVSFQPGIDGPESVASLLEQATVAGAGFSEDYGEQFVGLGDEFLVTTI